MRVTNVIFNKNDLFSETDESVDETQARALAVNEALQDHLSEYLENQQRIYQWCLGIAVFGGLLGVIAFILNMNTSIATALLFGSPIIGGLGYVFAKNREPEVTVNEVQKGYWTGYCIPDEEGVIVYDATESLDPKTFELERLSNKDAVTTTLNRLNRRDEFPIVMPRDENVEKTLINTLDDLRSTIESANQQTVEAPVVPNDGPKSEAVKFFANEADDESESVSVDVTVPPEEACADVEAISELEKMAADNEGETELGMLSETSRQLVSNLSGLQETAIDLLNDHVGTAADAFGLVSYNFYCPDCQIDEIDSRVQLSDSHTGEWYCETCRNHHETEAVIPRHRIKDDVVNPVWDQLWAEKDDQRRNIYENIEDQKKELQEREFEQHQEEIRSSTERIRDLRSRIRDLKTEAKAAEGKVEEIGDLLVKYERLHKRRKRQFQKDVEEAFAEINEQTERIIEETRSQEQERIEQAQQEAQQKAELIREEERRREVEKFMAEQRMENKRTKAQMKQQEKYQKEQMKQQEKHHEEKMFVSGKILQSKQEKNQILGTSARTDGGVN